MKYILMNAEHEVLEFDVDFKNSAVKVQGKLDGYSFAPIYFDEDSLDRCLSCLINSRILQMNRRDAGSIIGALKANNAFELSFRSLGLSLTDCYWYKPVGSSLKWEDVNCFERDYDKSLGEAILKCDYETLAKADLLVPDLTLGGITKKAWVNVGGKLMLLKSEAGESPFVERSELLSARLTERLLDENDRLTYTREDFCGESYIACEGMIKDHEELIPAGQMIEMLGCCEYNSLKMISKDRQMLERFTETVRALGVEDIDAYLAKIAAAFNLTLAGDCHTSNFGFIRDLKTMKLRAAPLYDRGRSFGCFGQPTDNGQLSAASVAVKDPKSVFLIVLFNSTVMNSSWDYSWFSPSRLDGFHEEIEQMLKGFPESPDKYIELLKAAYDYQLSYICSAAGK